MQETLDPKKLEQCQGRLESDIRLGLFAFELAKRVRGLTFTEAVELLKLADEYWHVVATRLMDPDVEKRPRFFDIAAAINFNRSLNITTESVKKVLRYKVPDFVAWEKSQPNPKIESLNRSAAKKLSSEATLEILMEKMTPEEVMLMMTDKQLQQHENPDGGYTPL